MKLDIRKRLKISNILMIAIPIGVCFAASAISLAVFFAVLNGTGIRFNDENFYNGKEIVAEFVEKSLASDDPVSALNRFSSFTKSDNVRLKVLKNGDVYYEYGLPAPSDETLDTRTNDFDTEIFVADGARQLYVKNYSRGENVYRAYIYCSKVEVSHRGLKIAAAGIVCFVLALSVTGVVLTDRFLSRFVFEKIKTPLDDLALAAREVAKGNLGYIVFYDRNDEFTTVIDEFNSMTEQLRISSEMLKDEEVSRNLLLTGITHDIKSPLTVISGYAEGLCEGVADTPEKQKKYLLTIRRKCADIDSLVKKMIMLTKTEYELSSCNETIDVASAVNSFLKEEAERYAEKGLNVSFTAKSYPKIRCTKENFARILGNIADNSLKYKKGERGELNVLLTENDKHYILVFSDDGVGTDEEDLPHIFEPFYRADKARTCSAEHNGIGLTAVKHIVSAAGGEISAENNEKGGLNVTISFGKQDEKNSDRRR